MRNATMVWVSDPPASPTGFGTVTDNIVGGLRDLGFSVRCVDSRWVSTPLLVQVMKRTRPDFLITLVNFEDAKLIALADNLRLMRELGVSWILYFPIDTEP